MTGYRIRMDDNRRLTGATAPAKDTAFATEAEAVAAARELVEEVLAGLRTPGMTADELLGAYFAYGQYPAVVAPAGAPHIAFSAWDHAATRAAALCAGREVSA